MLLAQAAPPVPDTSAYFHAAYIAAAVLYGGYVLSLWIRMRRVRERLRTASRDQVDSLR